MKKLRRRHIIILLSVIITLSSCENTDVGIKETDPKKVILHDLITTKNTVTLNWSSICSPEFQYYKIRRYFFKDRHYQFDEIILDNKCKDTTFTDTIPELPYIAYEVLCELENIVLLSEKKIFKRPNTLFYQNKPANIVFYEAIGKAFLTDITWRNLVVLNYRENQVDTIIRHTVKHTFPWVGNNGNGPELLLPREDGILEIYNAKKMIHLDELNVNKLYDLNNPKIYGVTTNNDLIYLSLDDWASIKVISRKTLATLNKDYANFTHHSGRLFYLKKSDEILEISSNISPTNAGKYYLNENGFIYEFREDNHHGVYGLDDEIITINENQGYYISSREGELYSLNTLWHEGTLGYYSDFTTNENGSTIYACKSNEKRIDYFDYPELQKTGTLHTEGEPLKIHYEADTLYVISTIGTSDISNAYIRLEKIALNSH